MQLFMYSSSILHYNIPFNETLVIKFIRTLYIDLVSNYMYLLLRV